MGDTICSGQGPRTGGAGRLQHALGLRHLVPCAIRHHEELVRLEGRLVLHNTVCGDAQAIQPGAEGAQPAPHHCTFQGTDDPAHEGTEHQEGADAGNNKETRPDQQAPQPAPQGPPLPPDLHTIAGGVVAQ